jgi:hypothetical protein
MRFAACQGEKCGRVGEPDTVDPGFRKRAGDGALGLSLRSLPLPPGYPDGSGRCDTPPR